MRIATKLLILSLTLVLFSCKKDKPVSNSPQNEIEAPNLPATSFNYASQSLPNYYLNGPVAAADNTPSNNPVTDAGATLGRVLFYDKQLSINGLVSCASCHQANQAFSDQAVLSIGFDGGETGRHSMSLANSRYYANGRFFWDERATSLEDQVLHPIEDPVEMGMSLDSLEKRLQSIAYYPELFQAAFGSPTINREGVSLALAQFIRAMVSFESKYDEGRRQVPNPAADFPNFSAEENRGKALFLDPAIGCAACHGTDAFIAPGPRNNGLDPNNVQDGGVGAVNGNPNLVGTFKVGSLRNIARSAPYMHDGRFATLQEVITHYNNGVRDNPTLSVPLRLPGGGVRRLNLSAADQQALVAFLETLTDEQMLSDEKFSDPFAD